MTSQSSVSRRRFHFLPSARKKGWWGWLLFSHVLRIVAHSSSSKSREMDLYRTVVWCALWADLCRAWKLLLFSFGSPGPGGKGVERSWCPRRLVSEDPLMRKAEAGK